MTRRLAIVGVGKMGRAIGELAPSRGWEVVARLDDPEMRAGSTPASLNCAGVAVEFTVPEADPGLLNVCAIVAPDPAEAPVIPPVIVPIVQEKLLGILEVRLILVAIPLQVCDVAEVVILGIAFTVAVVVDAGLVHPFKVTVTEYTPDAAVVALAIVGFCRVETKPFGPVQLYVAPGTFDAVRFSVDPAQTAPPFDAVTLGMAFTVAVVVDAGLVHPFRVTVTEYTPEAAVVALAIVGFC
jgi:hypothetical protein